MANLMKNPIEWRKKELEKLTVANACRKYWVEVERQKAGAIMFIRKTKMHQI